MASWEISDFLPGFLLPLSVFIRGRLNKICPIIGVGYELLLTDWGTLTGVLALFMVPEMDAMFAR